MENRDERYSGAQLPEGGAPAKKKKNSVFREVLEWCFSLGIALAITLFITLVLIVNARIPTPSMVPTINPGDRVIGLRMSYWFSTPQRGDIVIFHYPDNEEELYVKRVIGLPGDTVEIKNGLVYINGSTTPLDEPYLSEEPVNSYGPYNVPEGHYFVMGDNRNRSWDSRFWQNTYVEQEKIIGKAVFRLFPDPGLID